MKNIREKESNVFSNIGHHIINYFAKFEAKIPLVRGEIKTKNLSRVDRTN